MDQASNQNTDLEIYRIASLGVLHIWDHATDEQLKYLKHTPQWRDRLCAMPIHVDPLSAKQSKAGSEGALNVLDSMCLGEAIVHFPPPNEKPFNEIFETCAHEICHVGQFANNVFYRNMALGAATGFYLSKILNSASVFGILAFKQVQNFLIEKEAFDCGFRFSPDIAQQRAEITEKTQCDDDQAYMRLNSVFGYPTLVAQRIIAGRVLQETENTPHPLFPKGFQEGMTDILSQLPGKPVKALSQSPYLGSY